MRFKRATPSYRLICMVLAAVLLLALAVPGLAEHQWSDRIRSFERVDPVYDEAVELGTAQESLHLPETLRAIVDIPEELDVTTFVQAAPEADTSDGSTSFDYYWYGYVAPQDADALVEAGEKAIYTIYYADGQLAYRLYGSIAGSENLWFACDEAGNITGAVLDIPVTWSGSYDGETAGTYTFTASVSAESPYHWSGSAPSAQIYVLAGSTEEEPVCTCGAQPGEDGVTVHAEDCPCFVAPEPVCTCGAQPGEDGVTVHAEDCPCFVAPEPVCTCGAQPGEDGVTVHAEDCPCFVAQEPVCTCGAQPGEDGVTVHAEDCPCFVAPEPVCTCGAQPGEDGVTVHAEDCPLYVMVLTDCHCGSDGEAIAADNFPWAHQEDCRYFSPTECMCRELVETEIEDYDGHTGEYLGTHTEYIPGDFSHVHDPSNRDCLLYGKDTVRVTKLDTGEETVMAVEDAERLTAYQTSHRTGDESAQEAAMYPALGCISIIEGSEQAGEYDPEMMLYAAGPNEQEMVNAIKNNVKTEGNQPVKEGNVTIPATWRNYVNTRFRNQYDHWKWVAPPAGTPKWNGKTESVTADTSKRITVSTPQQLRGALAYYGNKGTPSERYTIELTRDMDMNGANYNWNSCLTNNLVLDGKGHTLYNLGCYIDEDNRVYKGFLHGALGSGSMCNATIKNLNFEGAELVYDAAVNSGDPKAPHVGYGGLFIFPSVGTGTITLENVHVRNSIVAQTSPRQYEGTTIAEDGKTQITLGGAVGILGYISKEGNTSDKTPKDVSRLCQVSKCSVENSVVAGLGHPGALFTFVNGIYLKNSCGINNTVYSMTQAHGGLLCSCSATFSKLENCFASGEMYAQSGSGGLVGQMTRNGNIVRCFATGKLEASRTSAGFTSGGGFYENYQYHVTIEDCYTTVLVGLRSDNNSLGGFIGYAGKATIKNSYAAGEVGDFSTDLTKKGNVGGFVTTKNDELHAYTNCYYDKQTTAMREWAAGNTKNLPGVTGLLTSTSPKNKTGANPKGNGMASGSNFGLGSAGWTYTAGHYPQLNVFADATPTDWGDKKVAPLVRAASSASTATVFLNTWDKGYDWDNSGVRSADKVSYNRSPDGTLHRADKLTYDTVREIISPFTVTDGTWKELITGGAKTKMKLVDALQVTESKNVVIAGGKGTVAGPGMNWFSVTNEDPQSSRASLSRPLRLVGYMSIDAGNDRTEAAKNAVKDGGTYDHRRGVTLTMMDEMTDNLVVGINNEDFWSTAKRAGYPTVSNDDDAWSTGFYGVPTDNTNHLATRFSASKDAILNTEIWRVDKDSAGNYIKNPDGTYKTKYSVKVTGEGTNGPTLTTDEKKWNGETPFSVSEKQMYVVSYYWQLADGRYVTDSKLVEIVPSSRHLQVVACRSDNTLASTLQVDAQMGEVTSLRSTATGSSVNTDNIPVASPSTAVWKKTNPDTVLKQLSVRMVDNDDNLRGEATIDEATIRTVTSTNPVDIPVKVTYFYTTDVDQGPGSTQQFREESLETTATVTYQLCVTNDGEYYIQFNRRCENGTATPAGTVKYVGGHPLNDLNFKPMHYNVHVAILVEENAYLKVQKVVSNYTDPMAGQTFTIDLSGAAVSQVNLHHNDTSKIIKVPITADSNKVTITEWLPMEFSQQDITLENTKGSAELNRNVLTLHAGDEVTVVVTNRYDGKGYFKSRTQANNTFMPAP